MAMLKDLIVQGPAKIVADLTVNGAIKGTNVTATNTTGVYIQSSQPSTPPSGYIDWFKTIRNE